MNKLNKMLAIAGTTGALFATQPVEARLGRSWLDPFFEPLFTSDEVLSRIESSGVSMYEQDDKFYVETALPGVSENDVSLTLENGTLTILGSRKNPEENARYFYKASGNFNYRINLPESIDETEPEATFKNGMMTVVFEKKKSTKPRSIKFTS